MIRNYTRFSGENLDSGTELALTSASYVGMYASRPLDALVQLDPDGLGQGNINFHCYQLPAMLN